MVKQSLLYEESSQLLLAEAVRVAYHGDKQAFQSWYLSKMNRPQKKKTKLPTGPVADESATLASLGINKEVSK